MVVETTEELLVRFPETLRSSPTTTECRSTLLLTSIRALQNRGQFAAYRGAIDPVAFEAINSSVAGVWLPIGLAVAHYRACDALGLTTSQQLECGAEVVTKMQQTFIATVLKAARATGAIDPWTAITKFHQIHPRSFQGGGARIVKLGPKEARLDVVGLPLAAIPYFRVSYRGFIRAGVQALSCRAFANDVPHLCTSSTLGFRVAWA